MFSTLRDSNQVYVDKTALIYELASEREKIFLSRPRRFGKSLLTSTFESLFLHGLRDFKGLAIEKLWTDKTYPVVHMDFSGLKNHESEESFRKALEGHFTASFAPLGFRYDIAISDEIPYLEQFRQWLKLQPSNAFVLLIDEYDAPLTAHIDNDKIFDKIRAVLNEFFAALKEFEGCLRFYFMTGITKYRQTSIFSELNNFTDVSFDSGYGTLLGYTEEEILTNFAPWVDRACRMLNLSREELLTQLKKHYDGFCFDEFAQTHVYCPWSVLNFLKRPSRGFQNYWYESGGRPAVLLKYFEKHKLDKPEMFDLSGAINLSELGAARHYNELNIKPLLFQAGYLSIKASLNAAEVLVDYPNKEVEISMARLFADQMLRDVDRLKTGISLLGKMLDESDPEVVIAHFNAVFNAINYKNYPVTGEASCRSHLQLLLMGGAMVPDVEKHSALGRSDLEVSTPHRHWVFELKYSADGSDEVRLLEQAVRLMQDRRYGETPHNGRDLVRLALVFNAKTRRFEKWQVVPVSDAGLTTAPDSSS